MAVDEHLFSMITAEEIQQLPMREKLPVMETLGDDIARHESELEMPQWQKDLLDARERLIAEGKAKFIDWDEAKQQIAKATSFVSSGSFKTVPLRDLRHD